MIYREKFWVSDRRGVTLLELLAVIAIIGILTGTVTVSLFGQRQRGEDTKILAELSATIQPMLMCQSDGGNVEAIVVNNDICDLGTAYGKWPSLATGFAYAGNSTVADWSFSVEGNKNKICCNKVSQKCGMITKGAACSGLTPQL